MADFSAKDVKALRDATGAGMMDAKRALEASSGNFEDAASWLRERGLGKAAERSDRENTEGAVAVTPPVNVIVSPVPSPKVAVPVFENVAALSTVFVVPVNATL